MLTVSITAMNVTLLSSGQTLALYDKLVLVDRVEQFNISPLHQICRVCLILSRNKNDLVLDVFLDDGVSGFEIFHNLVSDAVFVETVDVWNCFDSRVSIQNCRQIQLLNQSLNGRELDNELLSRDILVEQIHPAEACCMRVLTSSLASSMACRTVQSLKKWLFIKKNRSAVYTRMGSSFKRFDAHASTNCACLMV